MRRMGMLGRPLAVALSVGFMVLVPIACSESPYDTTAVASENCPENQPEQCVALFGDPTKAGIEVNPDPDGPVITKFAPTAYFGDAPFTTDLVIEVNSPAGASLSCELDAEGDGVLEQHVDCPVGTVTIAYPVPGRYAPALRVTDSAGRVAKASEIVLSNRLVAKKETVLVDALPGLMESAVDGDIVALTFASESQLASLSAGAILLDRRVNGYVRKVIAVTKTSTTLVMQTEEHPVYDAFESGYFGMRYAAAEKFDDTTAQSSPGPKPQDLPGEIHLGPSTTNLSVPLPTTLKVEVSGVELALDNPALDIDFELVLFEASIPGRYAFILANSQITFESDASITGTVDLINNGSVFLPIGPLGVGYSTPLGKAALGAVVEAGVDAELNLSVSWHQKIKSKLYLDLRQTDPLAFDWVKKLQGYPQDAASVSGPPPTFEVSDGQAGLELTGKLFAAPQVVIAVGNAAGVMRRAKKDAVKYQAECKKFKGIRAAAGFEANVSFTAALETDVGGSSSLCLRLEREAKLFAEIFPGFEFCPSAEYSLLDDAGKDWWHDCWPLPPTCSNGKQDGAETDVDCGGSCGLCADGKSCSTNADCKSGSCQGGVCVPAGPTCPSGNGFYCGKQELGQNPSYLYYCQDGSYSVSSTCNGQGCQVNPPGIDDSCAACMCGGGTCCSDACNYDSSGTSCGTCKVCNGAGSCNNASNGSACPGGSCQNGTCTPSCACGGGTCCSNGCNFDGAGTSCGTCKVCDGFGSCGNASNGTACPGGTCQNGSCSANCGALTYWSPSSISDVDIDGTQYSNGNLIPIPGTQMQIEINESATPENLRLRVCKIDGQNPNLINSVHVYFKDLSGVVMFNGTLGTNGTPCSNYGEMSNESNYTNGEVLGGSYRVVSPTGSAAEWTYGCTKAGAMDATGTCWWDPAVPTTTRTCK